MPRANVLGLAFLGWCLLSAPVRAGEDFGIDLDVQSGTATAAAHSEALSFGEKGKPRPVLEVKAGEPVRVRWVLRRTAPKETVKDVVAHFFVVRTAKVGQEAVPKLDRDVAVESALTMDFKPGGRAQGELSFQIDKPGSYLLRLETIGAAGETGGHEYFAAVDLVVK